MESGGSIRQSQNPANSPYPEPAQSRPCTFLFLKILPFTPRSSTWSLFLKSPTKTLYAPLLSPHTCCMSAHLILLHFITLMTIGTDHKAPLSAVFPTPHPILESPQPTFLPECRRPRFTFIPNNTQNCSSVYFNILHNTAVL